MGPFLTNNNISRLELLTIRRGDQTMEGTCYASINVMDVKTRSIHHKPVGNRTEIYQLLTVMIIKFVCENCVKVN